MNEYNYCYYYRFTYSGFLPFNEWKRSLLSYLRKYQYGTSPVQQVKKRATPLT